MDSACDFDLLGESVPQVRVSARTLALLGFFIVLSFLTPFFLIKYLCFSSTLEGGALSCLTGCPLGAGKHVQSAPWREVRQGYVEHLPMTPVWIESHVLEVRHRAIFFFENGAAA